MAYKIVPAGKGLAMIQSDPMPVADAQAKADDLNKEEAPPEEKAVPEMPMAGGMMSGPKPAMMPPFGARGPAMAPMGQAARFRPRGGMPPFGG